MPNKQYGLKCKSIDKCPAANGRRISLEENKRIFLPIDYSSYKWKRLYNKRTSVERIKSRIDVTFGFKKHYIRSLKK